MSTGEEVFRRLQAAARSTASKTGSPAPTQEYLTRHVLESFLDRLTRSHHGGAFVIYADIGVMPRPVGRLPVSRVRGVVRSA